MSRMELEDLKGVGDSTAKKLEEAGYTIENIKDVPVDEIIEKTGLHKNIAETIHEEASKLPSIDPDVPLDEPEFDLEKENRYLVAGFREANPGLGDEWKFGSAKELKEAFEKYKEIGADST
ncbi:MAG: helix-hairpin-helix domain-containing protein [Methanobacterium sp. ERen5]|nr:MAG: helix-hairpin-helix domain-containing protein [Methanobacterium sp. ERen5]